MRSAPAPSVSSSKPLLPAWAEMRSPGSDIVLSTRARLARNLADAPFPHRAGEEDLRRIAQRVRGTLANPAPEGLRSLRAVEVSTLDDSRKAVLLDSHLISLPHALAGKHRLALVDDHRTISVLVNEEDHIRIQVILPGLQPQEAWQSADKIDSALSLKLPFAFHERYGYLTASLANCGTGMRVSLMVHLPALALLGRLPATWLGVEALGGIVRGLYGEGAEPAGNVYQVSNAASLGITEKQIVDRIQAVATYLLAEERAARDILIRQRHGEATEAVEKAQEALQKASRLTVSEGMGILSTLRLGHLLGYETHVTAPVFNQLTASLRAGVGLIAHQDQRARDIFYEDTRRPALFRNRIRQEMATESKKV